MTKVPCNGCILCCKSDAIRLLPGDDIDSYKTVPHQAVEGARMLAHKKGGDCIYLGEKGCTIHDRRPQMCREMDCRNLAFITYTQARKLAKAGKLPMQVWRKGRELKKGTA